VQTRKDALAAKPLPTGDPRVRASVAGPVATLALDNGAKRNALDLAMWRAIPGTVQALADQPGVRVLVLRGEGLLPFAAGADIAEFSTVRATAEGGHDYEAANEAAFDAIRSCPRPVLAAIRGFCIGGGLGLAMAADLRIASEDAVFAIPAARLGLGYPPRAMAHLVDVLGPTLVKDLVFTARRMGADEALGRGLVSRLVPAGELDESTSQLSQDIADNAPLTLVAAKRAVDAAASGMATALAAELDRLAAACFDSEDYREGRAAFLEKRPPRFEGR
jgi:enoyl-CoA hydratase/carnithine racemase